MSGRSLRARGGDAGGQRRHVRAPQQRKASARLTLDGRDNVGRKDVRVDEVRLRLKVLDDLERPERKLVPGLVPVGVELRRAPVRRENLGVVVLGEKTGEEGASVGGHQGSEGRVSRVETHDDPVLAQGNVPLAELEVAPREQLRELVAGLRCRDKVR